MEGIIRAINKIGTLCYMIERNCSVSGLGRVGGKHFLGINGLVKPHAVAGFKMSGFPTFTVVSTQSL